MTGPPSSGWGRSRAAKAGILAVMAVLVAAAGYTSMLIMRRQAALREVSGYNVTWLVSQATLEVARLHGTIAAAMVPGSGVDADDVDLRLDIVANRVNLMKGGDVAGFIATSPELIAIAAAFRDAAVLARTELDAGPTPERLLKILKLVDSLNPPLARLAAAANSHGGNLVAVDQQQLSDLHWTFAALLGAITLCGFALVGAMCQRPLNFPLMWAPKIPWFGGLFVLR